MALDCPKWGIFVTCETTGDYGRCYFDAQEVEVEFTAIGLFLSTTHWLFMTTFRVHWPWNQLNVIITSYMPRRWLCIIIMPQNSFCSHCDKELISMHFVCVQNHFLITIGLSRRLLFFTRVTSLLSCTCHQKKMWNEPLWQISQEMGTGACMSMLHIESKLLLFRWCF